MINSRAFRFESVVADILNLVIVDVGIERQPGVLQRGGRTAINPIEIIMDLISSNDGPDVSSQHNARALHRRTFDRLPGPFAPGWIINLVVFDAGIVPLVLATGPINVNAQLYIADAVLSDHHMRGICCAHSTAIQLGTVEACFEAFDPDPILPRYIESMVEEGYLPIVFRRVIQDAYVKPVGTAIEIPSLVH